MSTTETKLSAVFSLDALAERLGAETGWSEAGGARWLDVAPAKLRALTQAMNEVQARLVTITASELADGLRLDYHWDLDGQLLGFRLEARERSVASIFDLCPAADWIEREIHDAYAVEFTGRVLEPLLLRQGDRPGVNLDQEAK